MSDFLEWDRRTAALLEDAYVAAGAGPGGSGSADPSEGAWRAKRQHLAVPMDEDGTWLDVGCANGHLLATTIWSLPTAWLFSTRLSTSAMAGYLSCTAGAGPGRRRGHGRPHQ